MTRPWYCGYVDTDRYPIHDRRSPRRAELVAYYRSEMDRIGVAEIPGFVTSAGVERMVEESVTLEPRAYHNRLVGNAYLDEPDPTLPGDHARRLTETTSLGAVAYDQIPETHLLRRIYEWDELMDFLGDILGLSRMYRYADTMSGLNVAVMKDGDYLRWHFDQTDFVTSLAIRSAEEGGLFEFAPRLRAPGAENYEAVKGVIQGDRSRVKTLANRPGTLVLFQGRYSLHRVTRICGGTSRLIGLLGYDSKPGSMGSEYLQRIRYGRTAGPKA